MQNNYKTLYLCYFGLREPLVQSQVLPYLRQIRDGGFAASILTFENDPKRTWTNEQIETERAKLADEGIEWNFLTYHKTPTAPATIYDVLTGAYFIWKKMRVEKVDILHARVHVPAMMGAIARKFSRRKPKLIFDIRGFFPEEYTDAGRWKKNGWLYKAVKRAEKWLLKDADAFVVLTERAREILFPESKETGFDRFGRPVEVIPCCVDLERFSFDGEKSRREIRSEYNLENRRVITYVGSLGTWYLVDEMADLIKVAREQDDSTFALILTQSAPEIMADKLIERGLSGDDFVVKKVSHHDIPRYLSASDTAISLIQTCFSKQSSSPTKIAEYLASGLPVISTRGIGDLDELIKTDQVGALLTDFTKESYAESLRRINELKENENLAEICKLSAERRFDLEKVGGRRYLSLYRRLFAKKTRN